MAWLAEVGVTDVPPVNPDAFERTRRAVARAERRPLLDAALRPPTVGAAR